ncbi:MAG: hypothetical protein KC609_08240, partial [Myxococcales bacterium]|nr:hypothetical protein [Myxococcales bacterium]
MNEQEVDERNDAPDPHGVAADEAYPMELHIRATARRRYQVNEALFQSSGDVVFGNTAEVRKLAHAINDRRAAEGGGAEPIRAGQLYALGLIDEIMHYIVALYCRQVVPDAMAMCRKRIATALGADASEELLRTFSEEFPPRSVYLAGDDVSSYLDGATGGRSNREIALEELMLLGLTNENPASSAFAELFDDAPLRQSTPYAAALSAVDAHFAALPPFGPDQQTLLEMLRAPMRASPHSLAGQLRFMREKWGVLIAKFLDRMLLSSDLLAEEEAPRFGGPGPSRVLSFESLVEDAERFSEDRDWMPRVVLIAKSAYV